MTDVPPSETTRWRAVARVLRSPVDSLSCAILPASCVLCGSPLPQLSPVPICDVCWTEFPVQSGSVCARCGDALSAPTGPSFSPLCRVCRLAPPPFAQAVAYGAYRGRMKEAIHALKYGRLHPAARGLGRMLAEAIAKLAGEAPAEMLVVPVPLHRAKYAQRGFNQARSLAARGTEIFAQEPSQVAAYAGCEHADAAARHGKPGRAYAPPAPAECARRIFGFRSVQDNDAARFAGGRHSDHGRHGARRSTSAAQGRSSFSLGGNTGAGAAHAGMGARFRFRQHGGR